MSNIFYSDDTALQLKQTIIVDGEELPELVDKLKDDIKYLNKRISIIEKKNRNRWRDMRGR